MRKTLHTLIWTTLVITNLATPSGAQAPQHLVVPAAFATTDAVSYNWLAGASSDLRQQTIVGASHLQALLGRELRALELRRSAANEVYHGGVANLTVVLSTARHEPLRCDSAFAGNIGPDATQVWSGQVAFPTSPIPAGPQVGWTINNVVRIPFQTPFVYTGGTLCIDIVGQPIAGQTADWWMPDAEFEDVRGTVVDLGGGCGAYGGTTHTWSHAASRTLLPGAYARFWAYGPRNGLAVAAFGFGSPTPIPLASLGVNAPGCSMQLQPNLVLASVVTLFEPEVHPHLLAYAGNAEVRVRIPPEPWVFGLTLTTQWLEVGQPATSNAIRWTVAGALPTLDMALIEGVPAEARGEVSVHLAHVLRFEYR